MKSYLRSMRGIYLPQDAKFNLNTRLTSCKDGFQLLKSIPTWRVDLNEKDTTLHQPGDVFFSPVVRGKFRTSSLFYPSGATQTEIINLLIGCHYQNGDFGIAWRAYLDFQSVRNETVNPNVWDHERQVTTGRTVSSEQARYVTKFSRSVWRKWTSGVKIGGIARGTLESRKLIGRYGRNSAYFQLLDRDRSPVPQFGLIRYFITGELGGTKKKLKLACVELYETVKISEMQEAQPRNCHLVWDGTREQTIVLASQIGPIIILAAPHRVEEQYIKISPSDKRLRIVLGGSAAVRLV